MTIARALFALALLAGCSSPPSDGTFTEAVPDRASFPDVGQALVQRCGTLDCHGSGSRNLRLYGNIGLRWSSSDRTLSPPCTTSAEVDQDFDSVVGLQPEEMSSVATGASPPDSLELLQKPLGLELHKGGVRMTAGDDLYVCVTSWLAGKTDTATCQKIAPPTVPPPADGGAPVCEPGP